MILQSLEVITYCIHTRDMNIQVKQPSSIALTSSIFARRYAVDIHSLYSGNVSKVTASPEVINGGDVTGTVFTAGEVVFTVFTTAPPGQDASPSQVPSQQCWYSFAAEYTKADGGKLNCISF